MGNQNFQFEVRGKKRKKKLEAVFMVTSIGRESEAPLTPLGLNKTIRSARSGGIWKRMKREAYLARMYKENECSTRKKKIGNK